MDLPDELLLFTLSFLHDESDKLTATRVNRQWRRVGYDATLWRGVTVSLPAAHVVARFVGRGGELTLRQWGVEQFEAFDANEYERRARDLLGVVPPFNIPVSFLSCDVSSERAKERLSELVSLFDGKRLKLLTLQGCSKRVFLELAQRIAGNIVYDTQNDEYAPLRALEGLEGLDLMRFDLQSELARQDAYSTFLWSLLEYLPHLRTLKLEDIDVIWEVSARLPRPLPPLSGEPRPLQKLGFGMPVDWSSLGLFRGSMFPLLSTVICPHVSLRKLFGDDPPPQLRLLCCNVETILPPPRGAPSFPLLRQLLFTPVMPGAGALLPPPWNMPPDALRTLMPSLINVQMRVRLDDILSMERALDELPVVGAAVGMIPRVDLIVPGDRESPDLAWLTRELAAQARSRHVPMWVESVRHEATRGRPETFFRFGPVGVSDEAWAATVAANTRKFAPSSTLVGLGK